MWKQIKGMKSGQESFHSPVHESVLQQWRHCVNVIFAHFSNILEKEGKGLEHTVLHIQLWNAVLIHEGRQHGKR